MQTKAALLRSLIQRPTGVTLLGASGVFQARLIERAGFEAAYHPGGGNAGNVYGLPDTGLITATEMIDSVARMASSIDIPLFCDADDGYGGPTNVYRTVRGFERAGAAGVHIEDQGWPKRCGHLAGKTLVPVDEMVQKIHAATDARQDADFVLVARSDAIAVEGFHAALERCARYVEAGADAVFIDAPTSMEQLQVIGASFDVPVVLNVSTSGQTPQLTLEEATSLGFRVQLLANWLNFGALFAVQQMLTALRRSTDVRPLLDRTISFEEYMDLAGLAEAAEREERYGMSVSSLAGGAR